jgi:hypothetical protein
MTKARDLANASTALSAVSATELAFVDGVTSAIQTQMDAKTAKSTLTTTGDIYYASAANTPARLGIGSTGNVLTVASGIPSWAAPAGATDFLLLNSGGTALTGAATITVNITAYTNLYVFVQGASSASASSIMSFRLNGDTGSNYRDNSAVFEKGDAQFQTEQTDATSLLFARMGVSAANTVTGCLQVFGAKSTTGIKPTQSIGMGNSGGTTENKAVFGQTLYLGTSAITSVSVISSVGNFDAGTIYVYGAN